LNGDKAYPRPGKITAVIIARMPAHPARVNASAVIRIAANANTEQWYGNQFAVGVHHRDFTSLENLRRNRFFFLIVEQPIGSARGLSFLRSPTKNALRCIQVKE